MNTILSSVARELKLIFRNGISLYMAVAPALLALIFILVFGAIRETSLTLAVDASLDAHEVAKLEQIADIERFDSLHELKSRVEGADSLAGVTVENGAFQLLVEGNEGEEFAVSIQALVSRALGSGGVSLYSEAVEPEGDLAYDISMISVLLLSLFIGGATVGLSIVSERESGVIKAVAISPLRLGGYVLTKLIPALLLCTVGILLAALIIGRVEDILGFLLLALCSTLVSGLMTFIIGAFAKNQIAAIGVLKVLMPLSMVLPISAMFVPENWQFLFYGFPMYWQYIAIDAINNKGLVLIPCLNTLAVSAPWFAAAVLLFAKKTKLRIGR